MTLVYERDGRETKFQRCISSQGTGEYRIDSKLVSYDTYASRLQDLGVLASAHTDLGVSRLRLRAREQVPSGSRWAATLPLPAAAPQRRPSAGQNTSIPSPSLSGALRKDIWLGGAEGGGRTARQREEAAEDDQQYNFNKKRALGQERNNMKARRPPPSLLRRRLLAAAAASSAHHRAFCTTRRAEAKGRGREVLGPAREGRRVKQRLFLLRLFGIEVEVTSLHAG